MNHQIQRYHTLQQAHTEKLWLIDYLRHWLTSITEFDSMTYEANSINLVDLCQQSLAVGGYHAYDHALPQHDLLYHVVKHIKSFLLIFNKWIVLGVTTQANTLSHLI